VANALHSKMQKVGAADEELHERYIVHESLYSTIGLPLHR
jgi:hypothetical protein